MHARRRAAFAGAVATIAALTALSLSGCGEDGVVDTNQPADIYIAANTPLNAVRRVMATYSAEDTTFYYGNLTNDFHFFFSAQSDPDLVVVYGTTWGLSFEKLSTQHLYEGFTDTGGNAQPRAVRIDSDFLSATVIVDPEHADSTRHYQIANVPTLAIVWELEGTPNDVIAIESNYAFCLVRGDAAVLRGGQARDSTHWYLRRLEDHSTAVAAPASKRATTLDAAPAWGTIRARYLL